MRIQNHIKCVKRQAPKRLADGMWRWNILIDPPIPSLKHVPSYLELRNTINDKIIRVLGTETDQLNMIWHGQLNCT